jgi:hypothetical protein
MGFAYLFNSSWHSVFFYGWTIVHVSSFTRLYSHHYAFYSFHMIIFMCLSFIMSFMSHRYVFYSLVKRCNYSFIFPGILAVQVNWIHAWKSDDLLPICTFFPETGVKKPKRPNHSLDTLWCRCLPFDGEDVNYWYQGIWFSSPVRVRILNHTRCDLFDLELRHVELPKSVSMS